MHNFIFLEKRNKCVISRKNPYFFMCVKPNRAIFTAGADLVWRAFERYTCFISKLPSWPHLSPIRFWNPYTVVSERNPSIELLFYTIPKYLSHIYLYTTPSNKNSWEFFWAYCVWLLCHKLWPRPQKVVIYSTSICHLFKSNMEEVTDLKYHVGTYIHTYMQRMHSGPSWIKKVQKVSTTFGSKWASNDFT